MNTQLFKKLAAYGLASLPLMLIGLSVHAAGGLIPAKCDTGECGYTEFIQLIQNVANYLIVISAPIGASIFAYGGYLYMTAAGNMGQVDRAHDLFKSVFIGIAIMLSAWVIMYTLTTYLLTPGTYVQTLQK